jgi:hypothetical protein
MKINQSNYRRDFLKNALTFGAVATITPQLLNAGSIIKESDKEGEGFILLNSMRFKLHCRNHLIRQLQKPLPNIGYGMEFIQCPLVTN